MLARFAPAIFVFLWSTGFISGKYGLVYADPAIFLAIRFSLSAVLLALLVFLLGKSWPSMQGNSNRFYWHQGVVGLLMHGAYLGGVFTAIWLGVNAGTSALIVGLQPVLTAVFAYIWLKERLSPMQWSGLGLGFVGVVLVIMDRHAGIELSGDGSMGLGLCVVALLGISAGTVYQKRYGTGTHLMASSTMQFVAAAALMWMLTPVYGTIAIDWSPVFIATLVWLILVLSVCAILLLTWLISQGAATHVASLFYLVPPLVAIEAYILFDEKLGASALVGMLCVVLAVWMVRRPVTRQ